MTRSTCKITEPSAAIPVGELGKALVQWGQIDPKTGARRSTLCVGYDCNLSKRTDR